MKCDSFLWYTNGQNYITENVLGVKTAKRSSKDLRYGLRRGGEADVGNVDHVDAVCNGHHLVLEWTVGGADH